MSFPFDSSSTGAPAETPSLLLPAKIGLWQGARARGETGLVPVEGAAALAVYEVPALPDFSSPRFPDLSQLDEAGRVRAVSTLQAGFTTALHSLGPRCAFSLRTVCQRSGQGENRLRFFLIGRSFGENNWAAEDGLRAVRGAITTAFPREYRLQPVAADDLDTVETATSAQGLSSLSELLKPEQVLGAWHDPALCGFNYFYVPLPLSPADSDMTALCGALTAQPLLPHERIVMDVTLLPTVPLTPVEREEVEAWGHIADKWSREQKWKQGGGLYSSAQTIEIAPDPGASEAKKGYGDLLGRYASPGSRLFLLAVRMAWTRPEPPDALLAALAGHCLAPGAGYGFCSLDAHHPALGRALNALKFSSLTPAACKENLWSRPDAPETLRRLHRLVDIREASALFRLPIPGRDGCPGAMLDTGMPGMGRVGQPKVPIPALNLGYVIQGTRVTRDPVIWPLADVPKHGLIVGTPGSGKTTLCFSLLRQLWVEHNIPFLVLEPAKTEYRALLDVPGLGDDLLVLTPGNERVTPFRFNPLEVMEGESVSEHISTLLTCLVGALGLWEPLPMILEGALREVYRAHGWSEYDVGGDVPDLISPTLGELLDAALKAADATSYRGETAGNIRGALEARLGSLTRGPKGRCFNTRRSLPADLLLLRPVVLELEALGEDEKALVMLFALAQVRAYAKTTRRSGAPLSHVVLVEEAHVVIGRGDGASGKSESANPKAVGARFFTRLLAEVRALGEGLLIADQLPTAIAPEAVKSTNLKVMHRVVSADDRMELGGAMTLDAGQVQQAATLPPGHSLVSQEGWSQAQSILEENFKALYGAEVPPSDSELRTRLEPTFAQPELQRIYLPYGGCSDICRLCNGRVRESSERWAEEKNQPIRQAVAEEPDASRLALAMGEYYDGMNVAGLDRIRAGCLQVHFWESFGRAMADWEANSANT